MKRVYFILIYLVFWGYISGQSSTEYDVEFSRICLIDSIAPDTMVQFWRFTQANNPGEYLVDITYDLSTTYSPTGTLVKCCSCLSAASDTAAVIPATPESWAGGGRNVLLFGVFILLALVYLFRLEKMPVRIACTIFALTFIGISQGNAQSETRYDIEYECICLVDSIAVDTITQFWRFTQANNPGANTVDVTYDFSSTYSPTGTVLGCNDYYLGDNVNTGGGTPGTLPIWTGANALGNSSLTESGQIVSSSLTGALKVPSGTDAEVPVWAAGQLRYNTTQGGFQGGENGYYIPWSDADNFTNTYIPYSTGSRLTTSSSFKWTGGLSIGSPPDNAASNQTLNVKSQDIFARFYNSSNQEKLRIAGNGSLRFYTNVTGQGIAWDNGSISYSTDVNDKWIVVNTMDGGSAGCLTIKSGTTTTGQFGMLRIGDWNTMNNLTVFAFAANKIYGTSISTPMLISGIRSGGTLSTAGSLIVSGGMSHSTNTPGGSLFIRNGGQEASGNNTSGSPGKIYIQTYKDSSAIAVASTLYTNMVFDEAANIQIHNLQETPGETTDRILTMQDDTLKYREFAYAEMYCTDTNPDTVTFVGGSTIPDQPTDLTAGELSNFTYSAGRLTYTGTETAKFLINTSVSFSFTEGSTEIEGWIYKDGAEVSKSEMHRKIGTGGDVGNGGQTCIVELGTNSYIEIFFAPVSHTGDDDLIITNCNINLIKI